MKDGIYDDFDEEYYEPDGDDGFAFNGSYAEDWWTDELYNKQYETNEINSNIEFLGYSITGIPMRVVSHEGDLSFCNMETYTVFIQTDLESCYNYKPELDKNGIELMHSWEVKYDLMKGIGIHEAAHLWLSGSLKEIYDKWDDKKDGIYKEFKLLVNAVEDVRIENLTIARYSPAEYYLINHAQSMAEKTRELGIIVDNPLIAVKIMLDPKIPMHIPISPCIQMPVMEAIKVAHKYDVINGNWDNCVKCCREMYEIFRKYKVDILNQLTKGALKEMEALQKKLAELTKQQTKLNDEYKRLNLEEQEILDEQKRHDRIDELSKKKKLTADEKTELDQLKKETKLTKEQLKDKLEKDLPENRKRQEQNNAEHSKLAEQVAELTKKISELQKRIDAVKDGLLENDRHIKIIIGNIKDFEKFLKDNIGSKLTKEQIQKAIDEAEKITIKNKEDMDKAIADIYNSFDKVEAVMQCEFDKMPRVTRDGGVGIAPKVLTVDKTWKGGFDRQGSQRIPELPKAIEIGNEISSSLKRELNLKAVTLKNKTAGRLDIQKVRKQIMKQGMITDLRIMQQNRNLSEKHSVVILCDFSGSMAGQKLIQAKQAFATIGQCMSQMDVNYSMRGFCATNGQDQMVDVIIKDFDDDHLDFEFLDKVSHPSSNHYENRDGDSIRLAAQMLQQQRGKKFLIVISDGYPSHGGSSYYNPEEDTKLAIRQVTSAGIKVIGISIDKDASGFVKENYPLSFDFTDLDSLPENIIEMYVKAVHRG